MKIVNFIKNYFSFKILFFAFIMTFTINFQFYANKNVKVAYWDKPPISYRDENNLPKGFAVDIIETIAQKESWSLEYIYTTMPGAISLINNNKADILLVIGKTPERYNAMKFTDSYLLKSWGAVYTQKNNDKINSIIDLDGLKVGYIKNSFFKNELNKLTNNFNITVEFVFYKDHDALFNAISNNQIITGISDRFSNFSHSKFRKTPIVFAPFDLCIATQSTRTDDLMPAIDYHLKQIHEDKNMYSAIHDKWFGSSVIFRIPTYVYIGVFIILSILILSILIIIILNIIVKTKTHALENTKNNLETTLKSIGDGVIVTDIKSNIKMMNLVAENLTGWSNHDAIDKKLDKVFHIINAATREKTINPVNKVLESKSVIGLANHTVLISKDSKEYHIADSAAPIFDKHNNIFGIILVFRDVTDDYKKNQQIKESESLLRSTFESIQDGIVILNTDLTISYVNPTVKKWFNITDYHTGNKCFKNLYNSEIPCKNCPTMRSLKSKKVETEVIKTKIRQDESIRFLEIFSYPIIDIETSEVTGVVEFIRDITERIRIEELMIQNEKMLSVGGLAAGMAHEINNPLAGMMQTATVMANRLLKDMPANDIAAKKANLTMPQIKQFMDDRDIPKMINRIHESGKRAADIVQNMLSFARKEESSLQEYDAAELINSTIEIAKSDYNLKKDYDFKNIKIIKEYDKNLPFIYCEKSKIQQVILNLLKNGAEAMNSANKDTESRFIIRLHFESKTKNLCIEIEDNGDGMDENTKKRIFEPFYTTKSPDKGTGLGLSVSYFIITDRHKGKMYVESTPEKGTNFIIKLPIKNEEV